MLYIYLYTSSGAQRKTEFLLVASKSCLEVMKVRNISLNIMVKTHKFFLLCDSAFLIYHNVIFEKTTQGSFAPSKWERVEVQKILQADNQRREGEFSTVLSGKLEKSNLILGRNAQIAAIYLLDFSFKFVGGKIQHYVIYFTF